MRTPDRPRVSTSPGGLSPKYCRRGHAHSPQAEIGWSRAGTCPRLDDSDGAGNSWLTSSQAGARHDPGPVLPEAHLGTREGGYLKATLSSRAVGSGSPHANGATEFQLGTTRLAGAATERLLPPVSPPGARVDDQPDWRSHGAAINAAALSHRLNHSAKPPVFKGWDCRENFSNVLPVIRASRSGNSASLLVTRARPSPRGRRATGQGW